MALLTIGLEKIEFGDIEADGGVALTFAALGKTERDSLQVSTDDPDVTEILSEEDDDPVDVSETAGSTTVTFTLMNPDVDTYVELMGGANVAGVWEAPAQTPKIEKSLKITPKKGLIFTFPRCSINGKFNANFSRSNASGIAITATVLVPTKAGEPKVTLAVKP